MESDQAGGLCHIHTVFDMALQCSPSAIVLEDLDVIAKGKASIRGCLDVSLIVIT